MILFKYLSNYDNLFINKKGYIRATQLSALNDPFEANYDKDGLIELCKEIGTINPLEIIDYIEINKHKIGVISFSESKDNLLMWSHYANNYKGYTFGFYFLNSILSNVFSPNNYNNSIQIFTTGNCFPVKYRKQPIYKIDNFDRDYSNIDIEGPDRFLFEIFQQKSDEWIYEKEHRIILKLEQSDCVVLDIGCLDKYKKNKSIRTIIEDENSSKQLFKIKKENKIYFYLDKIKDSSERLSYGYCFAELAKDNPEIIFLFKYLTSNIIYIANGFKSTKIFDKSLLKHKYTYFENLKVEISNDYTLKFKKIEE